MSTIPKIVISGFYCGPSPSAGLGIAKSLRKAWPSAHLIGVDYWSGSSGLHDSSLSERWVYPSWDLLDEKSHIQKLDQLSQNHLLISALDIEVAWLSRNLKPCRNGLFPSCASLKFADKPHNRIGDFLPFKKPEIFVEQGNDQELYDFCRAHSWRVWVKGPYHGARFVNSWRELTLARQAHTQVSSGHSVFYQSHVRGVEESICFSAVDGVLCDAVHMQKRVITPEGKTWSGKIGRLSEKQTQLIAEAVKQIGWTGGGELELLKDESNQYWLMEFNPRFPAWIYGATLAGINLPAKLVSAATGIAPANKVERVSSEFTRIVVEVPVREEISLPRVCQPEHGDISMVGKYGASYGTLQEKLLKENGPRVLDENKSEVSNSLGEFSQIDGSIQFKRVQSTPYRICLESVLKQHMEYATSLTQISSARCRFDVAYSIKTCPESLYMKQALNSGLRAEAISMAEVERALDCGWRLEDIILNGPAKWWPRSIREHQGLAAVFCDSIEEFERLLASGRRDKLWGLRLKIPGFRSRFGTSLDSFEELQRVIDGVRKIPTGIDLGFHVHLASNLIGNGHWEDAAQSAIAWAKTISEQSGRKISMLDFGGGYHPRDFKKFPWEKIFRFSNEQLPELKSVTIEPGRALSQDTMAMVTSVQDIRKKRGEITEVVVDTCISELPLARVYPHRLFVLENDQLIQLMPGKSKMLGRICMEDDILADSVEFPKTLNLGDRIVIADAGAYERSMSYEFGYGRTSQAF